MISGGTTIVAFTGAGSVEFTRELATDLFGRLRTFGALAGIARDIAAVCPQAWLLNYTNPMAMN